MWRSGSGGIYFKPYSRTRGVGAGPGACPTNEPQDWSGLMWSLGFPCAQHVGEQAECAGDAGGELAEPGVGGVNVHAFAVFQVQLAAGMRVLAGVVGFEDALIFRVP